MWNKMVKGSQSGYSRRGLTITKIASPLLITAIYKAWLLSASPVLATQAPTIS